MTKGIHFLFYLVSRCYRLSIGRFGRARNAEKKGGGMFRLETVVFQVSLKDIEV